MAEPITINDLVINISEKLLNFKNKFLFFMKFIYLKL